MNVRNLSTAIALVSVVAFAAPASAVVSQSGVQQDVRSAVHGTSGNISVVVAALTHSINSYNAGHTWHRVASSWNNTLCSNGSPTLKLGWH